MTYPFAAILTSRGARPRLWGRFAQEPSTSARNWRRAERVLYGIRREVGRRRPVAYGFALACVALAFAARLAVDPVLGERQPFPTFTIAVAVTAWIAGLVPALIAIVLGYLVADWFFIVPRGSFSIVNAGFPGLTAAGFYLLITGVITSLTESMRRAKRRADRETDAARASATRLEASQEQLHAFAAHLLSVREEERTRIATDLHDDVGQALTALKLQLAWLDDHLARSRGETDRMVADRTRSMMSLVDQTVDVVRRTTTDLRPPVLDAFGLRGGIEWMIADFERQTKIRCAVAWSTQIPSLPPDVTATLFRIVQESLTNIVRHARANHVRIALLVNGSQLEVEIADDGRGITEAERTSVRSLGMIGMLQRVRRVEGTLTVSGAPGHGTKITASLPLSSKGP